MEDLQGGLIEDYILEFVQACSNEPNSELAKSNVPLSMASEEERARKYSFDKIRKIFLVYNKCKGTQADTVIKALAENYFIRAYVAYKIPQVQRKDFLAKADIANSIKYNETVVSSFGETEASLCAMDIGGADEVELVNLRKLPAQVASLESELSSKTKRISEYEVDFKLEESARRKMQENHASEISRIQEDNAALLSRIKAEHASEVAKIREDAENEAEKVIRQNELASAERNRDLASALESVEKRLASVNSEIQIIQNESVSRVTSAELNFSKAKNELEFNFQKIKSELESDYNSRIKTLRNEAASNLSASERMVRLQYEERASDNKKTADALRESIARDTIKIERLEKETTRLQTELSFIAGTSLEQANKLKTEISSLKDERQSCRQELARVKGQFTDLIPSVYMDADQRQTVEKCSIA